MIKVDNLVSPSAEQFDVVIGGMRNAFKSYDRADSEICKGESVDKDSIRYCFVCEDECTPTTECFILGENDEKLAKNLIGGDSPSHRKFLRQLPLIMDITAPLFFWKQLDTYKIGTTANAESTMHTLVKEPFKIENFEVQHFLSINGEETDWLRCVEYEDSDLWFEGMENHGYCFTPEEYFKENFINLLNSLRYFYLKTKDQKYWYAINELLPQSYLQKRTWAANYEVVLTIMAQRIHHKIPEWRSLIIYWLQNIPYLLDFAIADGLVRKKYSDVVINDDSEEVLYSLELN